MCKHNWMKRGTAWVSRDKQVNVYKCSICGATEQRESGNSAQAEFDHTKGNYNGG